MFQALDALFPAIVPFLMILFRVMGLFAFVPVFSYSAVPMNVKVLLAIAITVCIWPMVPKSAVDHTLIGVTLNIVAEMSVGLMIGLLTSMVFNGIQLGGHLIAQQMGLAMATAYDPMFDQQSTVVEELGFWITAMVFFAIGGHRILIGSLVQSYQAFPMAHGIPASMMLQGTLTALSDSFHIAVRVAAPGLVAFFLMTMTMGLISRTIPQINMMTLGAGANLILGMVMIMVGIATWAIVAHAAWMDLFTSLDRIFSK